MEWQGSQRGDSRLLVACLQFAAKCDENHRHVDCAEPRLSYSSSLLKRVRGKVGLIDTRNVSDDLCLDGIRLVSQSLQITAESREEGK